MVQNLAETLVAQEKPLKFGADGYYGYMEIYAYAVYELTR